MLRSHVLRSHHFERAWTSCPSGRVGDVDGILALFADRAVVKDEGQEHRGGVAISKWMREARAKYDFEVEPAGVVERDGKTIVTGLVSGNFPGSPVSLRHEFTLDDEKIVRLEIG